jgi:predicted enzyme related to lactoylglutathione lyase
MHGGLRCGAGPLEAERGRESVIAQTTHFEIYGDDPRKLAAFYGALFGWRMEEAEGLDYWRILMDPDDPSNVAGGVTYRPRADPKGWLQFVDVESIDESIALAEQMGATVVRPKTAVPRTAWVAVLADPSGNMFAICQRDALAFPHPEPD